MVYESIVGDAGKKEQQVGREPATKTSMKQSLSSGKQQQQLILPRHSSEEHGQHSDALSENLGAQQVASMNNLTEVLKSDRVPTSSTPGSSKQQKFSNTIGGRLIVSKDIVPVDGQRLRQSNCLLQPQ